MEAKISNKRNLLKSSEKRYFDLCAEIYTDCGAFHEFYVTLSSYETFSIYAL